MSGSSSSIATRRAATRSSLAPPRRHQRRCRRPFGSHGRRAVAGHACRDAAEPQADFRRAGRLAGVAAAEDHVLHAVAAQALRALLAKHPGERVDDVALAAAVGADNGGDPVVEGQLGAIGKALEARDLETLKPHDGLIPSQGSKTKAAPRSEAASLRPGSGWVRFENAVCFWSAVTDDKDRAADAPHPAQAGWPLGPANGASV